MPDRLTNLSPHQSSRWGIKPRLIVAHSTESDNLDGARDIRAVAAWFDNPRSKASAHMVGDQEGNTIRIVPDHRRAWHAGWVNNWSLGYEHVGHANYNKDRWIDWYHLGLYRFAAQCATWSEEWGIPLQIATSGHGKGVITHKGVSGRYGHWDPGREYPLHYVVTWAKLIKERRRITPRKSVTRPLIDEVVRIQRKYRPGRVNIAPW